MELQFKKLQKKLSPKLQASTGFKPVDTTGPVQL